MKGGEIKWHWRNVARTRSIAAWFSTILMMLVMLIAEDEGVDEGGVSVDVEVDAGC